MDIFQVIMLIVNALATAVVALFTIVLKQRDVQLRIMSEHMANMNSDIKALLQHRESCFAKFADRDENSADHRRIWKKIEELNKSIVERSCGKEQCNHK